MPSVCSTGRTFIVDNAFETWSNQDGALEVFSAAEEARSNTVEARESGHPAPEKARVNC